MKKKMKNKLHYLIPPLMVILIFGIIMFLKGIYPFGNKLVAALDMDAGYIPVYYKIHDFLHGNSSLFYDFNLGAGLGVYGSLVMNTIFSPITWLVYFIPRANIPYFMSFLVLLRLALMSISAYYMFNKLFSKVDKKYKILFSVMYALSGYTLLMYSNIMWLDNLILFPFLILGMKEIFLNKKSTLFVVILTLSLLFSYYISFMFLLFILIMTLLVLIIYKPKNKREIMTKLFVYIIMSLLMSSISVLPSLMQSLTSYRLNTAVADIDYSLEKLIYLFPMSLAIILFIKQLFNYKKDKKNTIFYLLLFLFTCIGIVVEPINKMWHTGSYASFPFRYGFIPILVLILGSLHYLNTNDNNISKTKVNPFLAFISYIFLNIILFYVIYTFKDVILISNVVMSFEFLKQFMGLLIIFVISILIMLMALLNHKKIRNYLIYISVILEIITFGYLVINVYTDSTYKNTNFIEENYTLDTTGIYKYKDATGKLNPNYAYQLKIPSDGNWLHIISKEEVMNHYLLGYTKDDTILYSTGGTVFSDLITGNRYTFTYQKMPEEFYELLEEHDDIYYYESKYNLNYVIPYDGSIYNNLEDSIFNTQNNFYKTIFAKEDNIIDIIKPKLNLNNVDIENNIYYATGENASITFELDIKESSFVYINLDIDNYIVESIKVNDNPIKNPIIADRQNTSYPASEQSILTLGYYDPGILNIEIPIDYVEISNLEIGTISKDKFISLVDNKIDDSFTIAKKMSTMTISYENNHNSKSLLIPINYLDGYKITINGKKISYNRNINNFISVDLVDGKNDIVIKYKPPYFDIGLYISLFSIVIFNLFSILNKKIGLSKNKILVTIFSVLFIITELIFILKVYILCLF